MKENKLWLIKIFKVYNDGKEELIDIITKRSKIKPTRYALSLYTSLPGRFVTIESYC